MPTQGQSQRRIIRMLSCQPHQSRRRHLIAMTVLALSSVRAGAADHIIHQSGRMLSLDTITMATGEPVIFLNDDTVPHNIMSTTSGNQFDLGSQAPGSMTPVSFDKAGIVAVICAIHPHMQMTIIVTP